MLTVERADDFHADSDALNFHITNGEQIINARVATMFTYSFGKPECLNPLIQSFDEDTDSVLVLNVPIENCDLKKLHEVCFLLSDAIVAPEHRDEFDFDVSLLEKVVLDANMKPTYILAEQ